MGILKLFGAGLIVLGSASGAVIFGGSFGYEPAEAAVTFWLLFFACFMGGVFLYSLGTKPSESLPKVLKVAGCILLVLGLVSAFSIFLAMIGVVEVKKFGPLWALFVLCTPAGAVAVSAYEDIL